MTRKQRRLTMIGCALAVLAFAAGLVLYLTAPKATLVEATALRIEPMIAPTRVGLAITGSL